MKDFYNQRSRFSRGPNRYLELASRTKIVKLIKKLIPPLAGQVNYLDVGCGNCLGTEYFANLLRKITKREVKATGVDIAPSCKNTEVSTLRLDLNSQRIPFSKHFHIATVFETIEHVFNTDFMLESISNSLVNRGLLILTTLNIVCWKNRILVPLGIQPINTEVSTKKLTYGYKLGFLKKYVGKWKPSGHIRPFTLNSLTELLEDSNFQVVHTFGLENWRVAKLFEKFAKGLCTGIGVLAIRR
ncbi:MAG: class I SAM-dependent methyltransferase [Candidatus Freyarchaeota archaeon]